MIDFMISPRQLMTKESHDLTIRPCHKGFLQNCTLENFFTE